MFDIISHCQLKRERHKGGVTVCSPLTDNVMIRGICSLCMSELPLCSSDPYDTSSGSLQLISIKPLAAQTNYSHPVSSDRSQDSAVVNGEVMHIQTIDSHEINRNFKGPQNLYSHNYWEKKASDKITVLSRVTSIRGTSLGTGFWVRPALPCVFVERL